MVRPPRSHAYPLWYGVVPKPGIGEVTSRLWPYFLKVSMFPVQDERWFLPSFFPPPRFVRAPCSSAHLARLLSPFVLSASSPSINVYSAAPLQCPVPPIVRPPSSVRQRATNPPAPADQCPLPVSRPSIPYSGLLFPPDLYGWWYLAWVWVCVEGAKGLLVSSLRSSFLPPLRP